MRILHTADWHLGKKLEHLSRLPEQKKVLAEIVEIAEAEAVDAVIVAGDLFDNYNPSAEATELFYQTLKDLSRGGTCAVVVIAGNHDAPERIEAPNALARLNGIVLSGFPHTVIPPFKLKTGLELIQSAPGYICLKLPNFDYPLRLLLTPYANEFRVKHFLGIEQKEAALRDLLQNHWTETADNHFHEPGLNVLMTHLFVSDKKDQENLQEPEEEKPILYVGGAQVIFPANFPDSLQYVALGHLHRPHAVEHERNFPIRYAGSPLAFSFAEAGQEKSVVILEAKPNETATIRKVPITKGRTLFKQKFHSIPEALEWMKQYKDAIIELTIVSDTYLTSEEKQQLLSTDNDVFIIPEVKKMNLDQSDKSAEIINLDKRIEDLFQDYFQSKNEGQVANEEIMSLFKEVLGS